MKLACSLKGIVNLKRPGQGISDMVNAGFENVYFDMSMGYSGRELENYNFEAPIELADCFSYMLSKCGEKQLKVSIAQMPYLMRNTKRNDLNELLAQMAEEGIKLCGKTGCKYIIINPLFAGIKADDEWKINKEYYLRLAAVSQQNQVMILLKNQCRSMNGHLIRGICSDAKMTAGWIDELNKEVGTEQFGFCLDAGVCNLCGQDMYETAVVLGKRLKAVVLRDCDGHNESAMLPFTSVQNGQSHTDWLSLIRGIREVEFDGQIILDAADTIMAFSPLLRPQALALFKSVADYFKWQIEIEASLKKYSSIVLFGAGNMCRNYMKCYGEKYPPLFTCDNNKDTWGTSFCGLEVKAPEALKDIPPECGVFICNIYYREIENQLRDMGIEHIECFNDEYMPSFYFDRLKGV